MNIWKFPLEVAGTQVVLMPAAHTLSVGVQNGTLCLWAMCDPSKEKKERVIEIIGTGYEIEATERWFIGTVQMGPLVWHVFERPN